MPKLTVEGVGDFDVDAGKRLVLALTDEAGIDQLHACGGDDGRGKECPEDTPSDRRPLELPDPLRPRDDGADHQPAARQRPA